MAKGILTNREVKNKVTGVDIYVSDYQEVPHRIKNDYLYHVIVVSNLFYYKTREHRESDVVQFMVSKTFAEFEDLYKRLFKRFPSVNFPPLPGKSLFSRNPSGHLECMDKVLKMVACTQKLSSSPMVISFLRGDSLPIAKDDDEAPEIEEEPSAPVTPTDVPDGVDEAPPKVENEFHDVDLFETKPLEIVEEVIFSENIEPVSAGKSIFDDDGENGENDADLFSAAITNPIVFNKEFKAAEILDLSDDEVDELMNLSLTSEKQSAIKVHKRQSAKAKVNQNKRMANILDADESTEKEDMFKSKTAKQKSSLWRDHNHHTIDDIFGPKKSSLFDLDDDDDLFRSSSKKKEIKVDDMKQDDIMDYIKANDNTSEPKPQKDQPVATTEQEDVSVTETNSPLPSQEQNGSLVTAEDDMSVQSKQTVTDDILIQSISISEQISIVEEGVSLPPSEEVSNCVTTEIENDSVLEDISLPSEEVSNSLVTENENDSALEDISLPSEEVNISARVEIDNDSALHDLPVADSAEIPESVSPVEQECLVESEPSGETAETDNSDLEKDISIPFGHISVSVREPSSNLTMEHEVTTTGEQIVPSIVDGSDSDSQHNSSISCEQIFDSLTEQQEGDFPEQDTSEPTTEISEVTSEPTNEISDSSAVSANSVLTLDLTVQSEQPDDSLTALTDCPAEQETPAPSEEIFSPVNDQISFIHAEQDISIQSRDVFLSATDQSFDVPVLEENEGVGYNGDSVAEQSLSESIDCPADDPRDTSLPILADAGIPTGGKSFDVSTPRNGVFEGVDSNIQLEFSPPNCEAMNDDSVASIEHNDSIVTELHHDEGILGEQNAS